MRVFLTRDFARYARRERLDAGILMEAIHRAEQGLVQATLGGGLIKQRVARKGRGRSGGYRSIVAYQRGEIAIFLYAFAKNERSNIAKDELATLKELSIGLLAGNSERIAALAANGGLEEIFDEGADEAEPPRD